MARLLYLQSGGPTAVLNGSAQGVIETARAQGVPVCAAANGLAGLLAGELYDCSSAPADSIRRLGWLPGASFGTSRHVLAAYDEVPEQWARLAEVVRQFDIGYVLLNGGNGSMETALRLGELAQRFDLPLLALGVPKTIDNDLEGTDFSPGFPSAAKYLASSLREVTHDMRSMGRGRVFIMETMGRHVGWLAAACSLAAGEGEPAPLVLLPEVAFDEARVLQAVQHRLQQDGYCAIAVAEGLRQADGRFVAQMHADAVYGHEQLGGAGAWLAQRLQQALGVHAHVALVDCQQRAAMHLASATDARLAYEAGAACVHWALAGQGGVMAGLQRQDDGWQAVPVPLAQVAGLERTVPAHFIADDGLSMTAAFTRYLQPLLQGEVAIPYIDGLPDYRVLSWPRL